MRDLGGLLSSDLIFNTYIDVIYSKAQRDIVFMNQNCSKFRNINYLKVLYCLLSGLY